MEMLSRILMLLPLQFVAAEVAVLNGHPDGSAVWWAYVIGTGISFSIGVAIRAPNSK
jgi:hypothetical protein